MEAVWATCLKYVLISHSMRLSLIILLVAAMCASVFFLSLALKTMPLGTGYALWTSMGAMLAALVGIRWFGESFELSRLLGLALVVIGTALVLRGAR